MTLRKMIAHLRNRMADDGSLRNALLEVKGVSKPWSDLAKQQAAMQKNLQKWADAQPLPVIAEFIHSVGLLEAEFNEAIELFAEEYYEYYRRWKDILAERKDLNLLVEEHKKAEATLETARTKMMSAEKSEAKARSKASSKSDSQTVTTTMVDSTTPPQVVLMTPEATEQRAEVAKKSAVTDVTREQFLAAEVAEKMLADQVEAKTLEVQREIHQQLRTAFYNLSSARLALFKRGKEITEMEIAQAASIPEVVGYLDDGQFKTQPFAGKLGNFEGTLQQRHRDMMENQQSEDRGAWQQQQQGDAWQPQQQQAGVGQSTSDNQTDIDRIIQEDYSSLSDVQANRMIVQSQVETLRLENALERERLRLGRLRNRGGIMGQQGSGIQAGSTASTTSIAGSQPGSVAPPVSVASPAAVASPATLMAAASLNSLRAEETQPATASMVPVPGPAPVPISVPSLTTNTSSGIGSNSDATQFGSDNNNNINFAPQPSHFGGDNSGFGSSAQPNQFGGDSSGFGNNSGAAPSHQFGESSGFNNSSSTTTNNNISSTSGSAPQTYQPFGEKASEIPPVPAGRMFNQTG